MLPSHRKIIGMCREALYSTMYKGKFERYFRTIEAYPPSKVVYTVIVGDYDCLNLDVFLNTDYKYVCFTDNERYLSRKRVGPWQIYPLPKTEYDDVLNSRYPKMHPNGLFPEFKESIYVDANVCFKSSMLFDMTDALSIREDVFLAIPPHRRRQCVYDELDFCLSTKRDTCERLLATKEFLESSGFPRNLGLTENNVIYRKHNDERCVAIMNHWWRMLLNYSHRDQLSLFYVLWKRNCPMTYLFEQPIKDMKEDFRIVHHNRTASKG